MIAVSLPQIVVTPWTVHGTSSCQVCFNDLMQLFILMTGKNAALSYLFIWGLKNMIVEFQLWNLLADKNLVWH